MHDVLELDEQALIAGRTRKAAFDQATTQHLRNSLPPLTT
jgi:hypothetical protein